MTEIKMIAKDGSSADIEASGSASDILTLAMHGLAEIYMQIIGDKAMEEKDKFIAVFSRILNNNIKAKHEGNND